MKASLINLNDTSSKDLLKLGNQPKTSNKDFGSTLEKFSSKTEDRKINENNKTNGTEEKKRDNKVEKKPEESKDKKVDSKDKKEVESEDEIKDLSKEKVSYEDALSLIQSLLVDVEVDLEDINLKLNQIVEEIAVELDMEPVEVEQKLVNLLENIDLDQFKTKGEFTKESSFLEELKVRLKTEIKDKVSLDKIDNNEDNLLTLDKKTNNENYVDSRDVDMKDTEHSKNFQDDNNLSVEKSLEQRYSNENIEKDLEVRENKTKDVKNISKEVDLETGEEIEMETSNIDEPFMPLIKDKLNFNISNKVKVEEPVDVNPKEVVEQIVNKVKVDLTDNKNHIKLSLKPEALGNMTMDIEINKGGVIAKILVDNYKTKEMIESNIVQLKEGIEDTGMEIKTVEVHVGNNADFNHKEQRHFNFNQENKKFKNANRLKISNNYEDAIVVEETSNPNNPYEEDGFDLMA